ncbi:MAG: zinc ribbon domain-containing protein [Candidatus Hodarchaeales archaeon]
MEFLVAKSKLRPASTFATIGGIGLGISVILPYFSVTFLITISISPIDLGMLVWAPLIVSALLSLIAGINLGSNLKSNPKVCLTLSTLLIFFTWFILYLQYQYYYIYSVQEYGFAIPLNFGIGLIINVISSLMVIISTIIVFSNLQSYNFLIETFRQRRPLLDFQNRQQPYVIRRELDKISATSQQDTGISTYNYCTNCGKDNEKHQNFCVHCGKDLRIYH